VNNRIDPRAAARRAQHGHLCADLRLTQAESRLARAEAEGIVRNYVIAGSALGMLPVPLLDGILLFNLQLSLMGRLAEHYGVAFDRMGRSIAAALLTAVLPVLGTGALLSWLKLWPGVGHLAAGTTLSTLAAAVSYATGKVLLEHFDAGGTLADLSARAFRARFRTALADARTGVAELTGRAAG
jgi:uncharacterized protein (DUF697 family)